MQEARGGATFSGTFIVHGNVIQGDSYVLNDNRSGTVSLPTSNSSTWDQTAFEKNFDTPFFNTPGVLWDHPRLENAQEIAARAQANTARIRANSSRKSEIKPMPESGGAKIFESTAGHGGGSAQPAFDSSPQPLPNSEERLGHSNMPQRDEHETTAPSLKAESLQKTSSQSLQTTASAVDYDSIQSEIMHEYNKAGTYSFPCMPYTFTFRPAGIKAMQAAITNNGGKVNQKNIEAIKNIAELETVIQIIAEARKCRSFIRRLRTERQRLWIKHQQANLS